METNELAIVREALGSLRKDRFGSMQAFRDVIDEALSALSAYEERMGSRIRFEYTDGESYDLKRSSNQRDTRGG